jgi:hypothetical protein
MFGALVETCVCGYAHAIITSVLHVRHSSFVECAVTNALARALLFDFPRLDCCLCTPLFY